MVFHTKLTSPQACDHTFNVENTLCFNLWTKNAQDMLGQETQHLEICFHVPSRTIKKNHIFNRCTNGTIQR
jgi:hypothetical protein